MPGPSGMHNNTDFGKYYPFLSFLQIYPLSRFHWLYFKIPNIFEVNNYVQLPTINFPNKGMHNNTDFKNIKKS